MMKNKTTVFLGVILLSVSSLLAQGPGMDPGMGTGPGHGGASGQGFQSFPGWQGHDLEHNLILPQVAVGNEITTTLALTNMGNRQFMSWLDGEDLTTTGTIYFFKQNGDPMPVRIEGLTVTEFAFALDASEVQFLEITGDGPVTPGWMLVKVDNDDSSDDNGFGTWGMMDDHPIGRGERVVATVYYTSRTGSGDIQSQVAVMPAVFERSRFFNSYITAQVDNQVNTGVAVVNTSDKDAQVILTLRLASGDILTSKTITLNAGHQTARFVNELFAGQDFSGGFRGTLEIQSEAEGIVSMGLLMTEGLLTSLPTHHFGRWTN